MEHQACDWDILRCSNEKVNIRVATYSGTFQVCCSKSVALAFIFKKV